jgi:hypothetical protein
MSVNAFSPEAALTLYVKDPALYAAAVRPVISDEDHDAVMALATKALTDKATDALRKAMPTATPETVDETVDGLLSLVSVMLRHVAHKPATSEGGWSGRVLRFQTPEGGVKVTLTDPRA